MKTTALAVLTALFLTSNAHAVLLQVDLSGSVNFDVFGEWTDTDDNYFSTQDVSNLDNGSSTVKSEIVYDFDGTTGESIWDINIGTTDTIDVNITENDFDAPDGTGAGTLSTDITVDIVAEAGETNGTPVTLDWSTAIFGSVSAGGYGTADISIGSLDILSFSETSSSSTTNIFNETDSGQITTYAIGDSFTLTISVVAGVTDSSGSGADFGSTDLLTVSATVVPEPTSLSLLGLGALALLHRRARH